MKIKSLFKAPLIVSCIGLLSLASCQKDNDDSSQTQTTKTDLLTANTWKISAIAISPNFYDATLQQTFEQHPYFTDCLKDNTIRFSKDGIANSDEGATKCEIDDPQTTEDKWEFDDNKSHLILNPGSSETKFTIETIDKDQMIFTLTDEADLGDGVVRELTYTFEKAH